MDSSATASTLLCNGGREAQCNGLQIRKTAGSNPARCSRQKEDMYIVKWKNKNGELFEREFDNLSPAMEWAKAISEFVTIAGGGYEIVGKFGSDCIIDGLLPDGHEYTWKKRR